MDAFELDELIARLDTSGHDSAEFFRAETLSMSVVFRPVGSIDTQPPHTEDEVYYVAGGRGVLRVAEEDRSVGPGSVAYVRAGVEHHFHSVEVDMKVLVFWAPPRGSNAPAGAT